MKKLSPRNKTLIALLLSSLFSAPLALATTYSFKVFAPGTKIATPAWAIVGSPSTTFASTMVGALAATPKIVTIKNSGAPGNYVASGFAGANASDFTQSNNCNAVPQAGTCAITINFTPSVVGAESASLMVAGSQLSFNGTGTPIVHSFATLNPADKHPNISLSSDSLSLTGYSAWYGVRATQGKSAGKWYWEVTTTTGNTMVGVSNASADLSTGMYQANSVMFYEGSGNYITIGTAGSVPGPTPYTGTYMFALDMDNGALYMGVNGAWLSGGIPSSGANRTGAWAYGLSGVLYPALGSAGTVGSVNFGASAFKYAVPSGFNAGVYQ